MCPFCLDGIKFTVCRFPNAKTQYHDYLGPEPVSKKRFRPPGRLDSKEREFYARKFRAPGRLVFLFWIRPQASCTGTSRFIKDVGDLSHTRVMIMVIMIIVG